MYSDAESYRIKQLFGIGDFENYVLMLLLMIIIIVIIIIIIM